MPPTEHPFLDPTRIRGDLYAQPERLASRTGSLKAARVRGTPVVDVLIRLFKNKLTVPLHQARVLDVGCGRGTTSRALAELSPAALVALDLSPALAATAKACLPEARTWAALSADFHHLPFGDHTFDAAVAAFCLYHSPDPTSAIGEISRCLRREGLFIAITKSADSYAELDRLLTDLSLTSADPTNASLYSAAHSANIADLASPVLDVHHLLHEEHVFRFETPEHLARYLVTIPKYPLGASASELAQELRSRGCPTPVETSSTVTYLVGAPHG
ncbi:class I SAM-dependent methyltransferase [Nocardiopsis alba]